MVWPHLKILWHGEDNSARDSERSKEERKTEEEMVKEWTGRGFGESLRAAEVREGWKGIVTTSSVVPRRPPRLRDWDVMRSTRTCIKYRTSSNFGQIGPLTTDLAALARLKISHILIIGKNAVSMLARSVLIESSSKLLVTRTGIKARMTLISGRIRPLTMNDENFTLSSLNISEASWPILIKFYMWHHWDGERLHNVLRQIGSKLWCPWQQKAPVN